MLLPSAISVVTMSPCAHYTLLLLQKLQRDVNCLLDENRSTRRRALERLQKETVQSTPHIADEMEGLVDFLLKPLLKEFSDPVEKCRELAIGIVTE